MDTVAFNPATKEALSTAAEGFLIVVKENSPKSFSLEQKLPTTPGARTMVLDTKTNHIFTMAFQYGPLPPNAPPPAPGRASLGPLVPGTFTILMIGK